MTACRSPSVHARASARLLAAVVATGCLPAVAAQAQMGTDITISSAVPSELNPANGGAPNATPQQAAAFAWQEFIALNWPAGPQMGQEGQRDAPSSSCKFSDPNCNASPTVWQTFRGKVEIFPGTGNPPPGYDKSNQSLGYDATPQYIYASAVPACDMKQSGDPVPWVNLDETDEITLNSMYAGVVTAAASPANTSPKLIRFLAKANRAEYVYAAQNQWWSSVPSNVVTATENYLAKYKASPPPGSADMVSNYNGTIEVKAAWRVLNPSEAASGRFHTATARSYESPSPGNYCFVDAAWGLVALHIIQKTPSAPYFIYATFEQADNILTASGKPVEDSDGGLNINPPATATSPQVCLQNPKPAAGQQVSSTVVVTNDPAACAAVTSPTYCGSPQNQLYYQETNGLVSLPTGGFICVNRRDNDIPLQVIEANKNAHDAIKAYLQQNGVAASPWLSYKLVNVQYFPFNKIPDNQPNGSPYQSKPPYSAKNPSPSTYYQANIVVETDRSLQLFSGGLVEGGLTGSITDWDTWAADDPSAAFHHNSYYGGQVYNMGGCMGCHGSQGQNPAGQAGDFSVILARGGVLNGTPEVPTPAATSTRAASAVVRNRSLRPQTPITIHDRKEQP